MNLITAHGGATVDTRYITQTRRVEYACAVEQNRATWKDWAKVVAAYLAGAAVLTAAGFSIGYAWGRFVEVAL